jgi:AcrR family transcriptional regulator
MKRTVTQARPVRGRPREFDRKEALRRAMTVFWQKGFDGASLSDLTAAMEINPPSLYAAFGDKEALYIEALQHYLTSTACRETFWANIPTARACVEGLLLYAAKMHAGNGAGCMLMMSGLNTSSAKVRKTAIACRANAEALLKKRIERGIREGELPADTDAAALAKFYETVLQGLSIQASDGASPKTLQAVVATAMRAWPEKSKRRKAA